jgi:hypothetical protein
MIGDDIFEFAVGMVPEAVCLVVRFLEDCSEMVFSQFGKTVGYEDAERRGGSVGRRSGRRGGEWLR